MESPPEFLDRLDFSVGDDFEQQVRHRFGVKVHHQSPSPRGSFFLLATFRRFLFRLSEESIALVLESCLGGHAPFFHVVEVSHNHFRFSVANKAVGFFVYGLCRVIGSAFDVYFHLWSNGTPHWEREKRPWEAEEAKKWTEVRSRGQIRAAKAKMLVRDHSKNVRFNPQLVMNSPIPKQRPSHQIITFGAFETSVSASSFLLQSDHSVRFGTARSQDQSSHSSAARSSRNPTFLMDESGFVHVQISQQEFVS